MKRLLLAALAVAAAAAWTVPSTATASEITFSGQYRLRGEYRNNADFTNENYSVRAGAGAGAPAPNVNNTANDSTNMWVQRVRLTANAKATDDTSVKITLQDSRTWGVATDNAGGGPQLTDNGTNTVDLHESYLNVANVFGSPVALRAGRQELAYGDERLIGSFGWNNNGRAFDAFKLMYNSDIVNVDLFTSRINVASSTTDGTQTESLHGVYATVKAVPNNTIDLYVLNLRNRETAPAANTFGAATGSNNGITGGPLGAYYGTQTLYTYGIRLKGDVAGADYTFELPYQTGTIHRRSSTVNLTTVPPSFPATLRNDMQVKSYAYAAKVGYTLTVPVKTRIGVEYDFASGDKHPVSNATTGAAFNVNDSEINTFYNLYPTNHDKLGLMDMQAWRNVKAWNVNLTVEPSDKLKLFASYWKFALAAKEDGWYNAGDWNTGAGTGGGVANGVHANPVNTAPNNNNYTSDIGSEFDFVATYKYNSALTIEAGAAHFWAGEFIKNQFNAPGAVANDVTGQDWAYLQLTANF
ncbi:hypothetical protein EPN18_01375 [bacterium]|nr:MAG: hypothetical protein EPN18_01375 [bacterium]